MTDQPPPEDLVPPLGPPITTPLADPAQFRLLVAFDALLVEGSVGRAAVRLGLSTPAMSRMLKQLRMHYGDPLFERTAQGMIPTARAEEMRLRLRALVAEANALLAPAPAPAPPLDDHPSLALDLPMPPGGGPDGPMLARRLARAKASPEGARRLAGYVALTGNATGRTRPMTEAEAEDAFGLLLRGEGHPVQLGALLVALQGRGATEPELAGFVRAARATFDAPAPGTGAVTLDWPAYLSPRVQGAPLFVLSARLVARAGHSVLIHGPADGLAHRAFAHAGLRVLDGPAPFDGLAFLPLTRFAPDIARLGGLYRYLHMPTAAHFVQALLNPMGARSSLLGQRSLGRPGLQRDLMARLGWRRGLVLNGMRDVAQILPDLPQDLFGLNEGTAWSEDLTPPAPDAPPTRGRNLTLSRLEHWQALWDGEIEEAGARLVVLETAAVALRAIDPSLSAVQARAQAQALWQDRRRYR